MGPLQIAIINVGTFLAVVLLLLLVVFPADHLAIDPDFTEFAGPCLGQDPPGQTQKRFVPHITTDEVHPTTVSLPDGSEFPLDNIVELIYAASTPTPAMTPESPEYRNGSPIKYRPG